MILYAIRHRPTGYYMPAGERRHTKEEPKKDCVPRLFKRKSDAINALNWWLQGVTYQKMYNDDEAWYLIKTPHRKAEEMEVVKVFLLVEWEDIDAFDPLLLRQKDASNAYSEA